MIVRRRRCCIFPEDWSRGEVLRGTLEAKGSVVGVDKLVFLLTYVVHQSKHLTFMGVVVTFGGDELSSDAGYEAHGAVRVLLGEGGADCMSTRLHVQVYMKMFHVLIGGVREHHNVVNLSAGEGEAVVEEHAETWRVRCRDQMALR